MKNETLIKIKIFTIFPNIFPGPLGLSVIGRALKNKIWDLQVINIRDFTTDKRKAVDDYPYGGGAGMVMRPDVVSRAIDSSLESRDRSLVKFINMSPRGTILNQEKARQLSQQHEMFIVCGRYEGIDQRVVEEYQMEEISIGNYVLSGGDVAALVLIDSIVRNLPNVLGKNQSLKEESFGNGDGSVFESLLEYPHYTKPFSWRNRDVPEILISGDHKKIEQWRLEEARKITANRKLEKI